MTHTMELRWKIQGAPTDNCRMYVFPFPKFLTSWSSKKDSLSLGPESVAKQVQLGHSPRIWQHESHVCVPVSILKPCKQPSYRGAHTCICVCCCCCCVALVVSDSVRPHRRQPTRLPIPGILQARTLEWVAISFSNACKWKVIVKSLSRARL